ncbi:hypothetical protein D3C78_1053720 [compost metagenome]
MVFHDISAKLAVNYRCHYCIYTQFTGSYSDMVYMLAMRRFEQPFHISNSSVAANDTLVTDLTSAFRIERSFS